MTPLRVMPLDVHGVGAALAACVQCAALVMVFVDYDGDVVEDSEMERHLEWHAAQVGR